MSSELDLLITVGHDTTSIKYYALATCTILFYDHLLTLADEIKYAWSGKKSWMFSLFIAIRYFPMGFQFWLLGLCYSPRFSTEGTVPTMSQICEKTAFTSIFAFVICTLFAQVVLTLRVYAVTRGNTPIAIVFGIITASQLALGMCLVALAAGKSQLLPLMPYDAYRLCTFIRRKPLEVAYISISLFYDLLVFSLIMFLALRWGVGKLRIPTIMATIAEDAMWYFLVIFTSHFVLEMTLLLGRESIQLLPASGNVVYLPVMISRLMLSLKKSADLQQTGWSLGQPSANQSVDFQSMRFFHSQRGARGVEDWIPLDTRTES